MVRLIMIAFCFRHIRSLWVLLYDVLSVSEVDVFSIKCLKCLFFLRFGSIVRCTLHFDGF